MAPVTKAAALANEEALAQNDPANYPLRLHPVMIELSKMKALLWQLDKYMVEGVLDEIRLPGCTLDGDEVEQWLRSEILDSLARALGTAEREFVRTVGMDAKTAILSPEHEKAVAS
jgi:hypothetical protein